MVGIMLIQNNFIKQKKATDTNLKGAPLRTESDCNGD